MMIWLIPIGLFVFLVLFVIALDYRDPTYVRMSSDEERAWLRSFGLTEEEIDDIQDINQ